MEQLLRAELRTSTLRAFGSPGAGGISEGRAYDTDAGPVFVKVNHRAQVRGLERGKALEGAGERAGRGEKGAGGRSGGGAGGQGRQGVEGGPFLGPAWRHCPGSACGLGADTCLSSRVQHFLRDPGFLGGRTVSRFNFFACLRSFRLLGLTSSPVKHGGRGLGVLGCFRRWP